METILFMLEAGQLIPLLLVQGYDSLGYCQEVLDVLNAAVADRAFMCVVYTEV